MNTAELQYDNSKRPPLNLPSLWLQIAKIQAYIKATKYAEKETVS